MTQEQQTTDVAVDATETVADGGAVEVGDYDEVMDELLGKAPDVEAKPEEGVAADDKDTPAEEVAAKDGEPAPVEKPPVPDARDTTIAELKERLARLEGAAEASRKPDAIEVPASQSYKTDIAAFKRELSAEGIGFQKKNEAGEPVDDDAQYEKVLKLQRIAAKHVLKEFGLTEDRVKRGEEAHELSTKIADFMRQEQLVGQLRASKADIVAEVGEEAWKSTAPHYKALVDDYVSKGGVIDPAGVRGAAPLTLFLHAQLAATKAAAKANAAKTGAATDKRVAAQKAAAGPKPAVTKTAAPAAKAVEDDRWLDDASAQLLLGDYAKK